LACKNPSVVPWSICSRWLNCHALASSMNILVTHVYREGNDVADSRADMGHLSGLLYFNVPPLCILNSLSKNKVCLPCFRFVE
jgi:hypothetical protein